MAHARAPYMEWARSRRKAGVDLAGSNLLACSLDDLPGAREALDIAGESPDGYPPLVEAIALRYGVTPDRVATANGCSGANFLACAAILESGDEVLMERPAYDPLIAAAKMLGARVRFFERRFEEGYALDPDRIAEAIGPMTRLIVLSDPHNPSWPLRRPSRRSPGRPATRGSRSSWTRSTRTPFSRAGARPQRRGLPSSSRRTA
jgi:histidinol-phosphate/aromatic aminotransferase/cobyric acid decarboxylase-like protein